MARRALHQATTSFCYRKLALLRFTTWLRLSLLSVVLSTLDHRCERYASDAVGASLRWVRAGLSTIWIPRLVRLTSARYPDLVVCSFIHNFKCFLNCSDLTSPPIPFPFPLYLSTDIVLACNQNTQQGARCISMLLKVPSMAQRPIMDPVFNSS
jgi:hypothetical protein